MCGGDGEPRHYTGICVWGARYENMCVGVTYLYMYVGGLECVFVGKGLKINTSVSQ